MIVQLAFTIFKDAVLGPKPAFTVQLSAVATFYLTNLKKTTFRFMQITRGKVQKRKDDFLDLHFAKQLLAGHCDLFFSHSKV